MLFDLKAIRFACLCLVATLLPSPLPANPPNLLIIQTDEHNFRTLGCYRATLPEDQAFIWGKSAFVETPNIDSIAARGAICTSFYATSPVCTPSRASFFSGRYPHNTGSSQNNKPLRNNVETFAEVLRQSGYATGYAGKWHLDGAGKPQWEPERTFGFDDNRFMFNRGHWKKFTMRNGKPAVAARDQQDRPTYGLDGADNQSFATDWLTDRALDFIRKNSAKPFCYHLSLPDPHGPNTVRTPYDEMFASMAIRPPQSFLMWRTNPKWAAIGNKAPQFNPSVMSKYFGMVRCIDDNVGRILSTLEELSILDHTIIVFTSDHGDLCFEHGKLNKGNPYEGSARIPMIIAAPGFIPAGTQVDVALGTVDFAPTILSIMNQRTTRECEGRDASPLLTGGTNQKWRDISFLRSASDTPTWVAAVSDRFKLILSVKEKPWLFDLQDDPDERLNHIDNPQHDRTVYRLAEALRVYGIESRDPQLSSGPLKQQLQSLLAK